MKKTNLTHQDFMKLCQKDLDDFEIQFGTHKLKELIRSGNLPLRKETLEILNRPEPFRQLDCKPFEV